jgi:predicted TIM-barrel fold metal-dependent hydrolase
VKTVDDLTSEDYRRLLEATVAVDFDEMEFVLIEIGLSDFDDAYQDARRLRPLIARAMSRGIARRLDEE